MRACGEASVRRIKQVFVDMYYFNYILIDPAKHNSRKLLSKINKKMTKKCDRTARSVSLTHLAMWVKSNTIQYTEPLE